MGRDVTAQRSEDIPLMNVLYSIPALFAVVSGFQLAIASGLPSSSGQMAFDEVEDCLRKYRIEHDEVRRAALLWKLGTLGDPKVHSPENYYTDISSRDPRVIVVLGESLGKDDSLEQIAGVWLLHRYYGESPASDPSLPRAKAWWEKNEGVLRRLARGSSVRYLLQIPPRHPRERPAGD
jgi:hypothetical protein